MRDETSKLCPDSLGPAPTSSTEDPEFMAGRLRVTSIVGLIAIALGGVAVGVRLKASGQLDALAHPGFVGLISGFVVTSVTLFVRPIARGSVRRMRQLETAMSILIVACLTPFTHLAERLMQGQVVQRFGEHPAIDLLTRQHGSLAAVFSLGAILSLRAALVPSSALRTGFVHLAISAPLLLISGFGWLPWDSPLPLPYADRLDVMTSTLGWWIRVSLVCVAMSFVVHRLRGEVRQYRALGQYVLEGKIGSGGMGTVYQGQHALLKRPMAIKLLDGLHADALAIARFEREARLTATLSHPNTIHVYDFGRTPEGTFYYAMELLEGLDVRQLVETHGAQPPARVIHILECVCRSLDEAHTRGLVHRDVKPANVFVCRDYGGVADFVKVLDFGLVRETGTGSAEVTQHGTIAGTPMYMAPEVLRNASAATARSDLYAVGALGYFLLSGHELFPNETLADVVAAQLHQVPVRPSERLGQQLPGDLEALVLACLEKDRARRPRDADEVAERLATMAKKFPWRRAERTAWWERQVPRRTGSSVNPTGPTVVVVREPAPPSRRYG